MVLGFMLRVLSGGFGFSSYLTPDFLLQIMVDMTIY